MYEFLRYRVRHVMTRDLFTVSPDTGLASLDRVFREHGFNGVPVVDDERRRLLGMVTKYDLLRAFRFDTTALVPDYERIMAEPVSAVMQRKVATMDPEMPLTRVLEQLVASRVKSFPVMNDDALVGIVAREDVLHALDRAREHRAPAGD